MNNLMIKYLIDYEKKTSAYTTAVRNMLSECSLYEQYVTAPCTEQEALVASCWDILRTWFVKPLIEDVLKKSYDLYQAGSECLTDAQFKRYIKYFNKYMCVMGFQYTDVVEYYELFESLDMLSTLELLTMYEEVNAIC